MKDRIVHNRIAALLLVLLVWLSAVPVRAADAPPDLRRPGAIHLTMQHEGEPVAGGTVTARRVAEIVLKDSTYQYALTEEFAESHADLSDLNSPGLTQQLAAYADYASIPGTTVPVAEDGTASFEALPLGVYLITQEEMAEDFLPLNPFLVTVPYEKDGVWMYTVEAIPKTSPELHEIEEEDETPFPDTPPGGGEIEDGDENGDGPSKLPQTGQLNWPIPVLAIAGLILFLTGWAICYRKGGEDDAS